MKDKNSPTETNCRSFTSPRFYPKTAATNAQKGSRLRPSNRLRVFNSHRRIDEGQSRPAQRFVLAEHQRQVTPNLGVGNGNGGKYFRLHVFLYMGLRDESHADIRCYKPLQQFARIELHGVMGLEPLFMKQIFE